MHAQTNFKNLPTKATQKLDQTSSLNYHDEQIIIRNSSLSFTTSVVILQVHHSSAWSPCFSMHLVHHRIIFFMPKE